MRKKPHFILYLLKRIGLLLAVFLCVKIPWMYRYSISGSELLAGSESKDILNRRAYLIEKIPTTSTSGATNLSSLHDSMIQGEWQLGTYSMTVMALTNIAFDYSETHAESLRTIEKLIEAALTPEAKAFDANEWHEDPLESLDGKNGHIGYLGHLNLMLTAWAYLGGSDRWKELHLKISDALARRAVQTPGFYLETYPGQIYTSDNMVVMASLVLSDRLYQRKYSEVVNRWIAYTKEHLLDPKTQLVGFSTYDSNRYATPSRGCGSAWNVFYLSYTDNLFALDQYQSMKRHYLSEYRLFAGLREFRVGEAGQGDVDSGPVIFGLSTSGTGFAIAGLKLAKEEKLLTKFLRTAEFAGFSFEWAGKRRYLLAPLVGDAIVLAMKTVRPWDTRYVRNPLR